ncbi:uncharacterized protein [Dysidea avara]|uniref:uncharacterized protein n=1 Tax=Dysidea avara TaxID=196820 RepID=UPI00332268CB
MIRLILITLALVNSLALILAQRDDSKCYIKPCGPLPCYSWSTVLNSCRILYFDPQVYELRDALVIGNRTSFVIIGNGATISCKDSASLLVFAHVSVLQVTNITLINCSATFAGLDISEPSSILLHNVAAIKFSSVVFKNVNGYAVYAINFQKILLFNIAYKNYLDIAMYLYVSTTNTSSCVMINLCNIYSDCSYMMYSGSSFPALCAVVMHRKWLSVNIINGRHSFFVSNNEPSVLISYLTNRQKAFNCTFINNNVNIKMKTKCHVPYTIYISSQKLLLRHCKTTVGVVQLFLSVKVYGSSITIKIAPQLPRSLFIKSPWCVNITSQGKQASSLVVNYERVHDLKSINVRKLVIKENRGFILEYNITDCDGIAENDNNNSICYCGHNQTTCSTNITISPTIYPGQSITIPLKTLSKYKTAVYVASAESVTNTPQCEVVYSSSSHQINFIYNSCTNITYTVKSNSTEWCVLTLKTVNKDDDATYTFIVKLRRCPLGLILVNGLCACNHHLEAIGVTCNVMDGTFNTSPYSWISVTSVNSESCKSDLMYTTKCYMDYCSRLPTIGVDLNESNSQCLNNRDGVICGKCMKGYSAVFGTSNCKKCSNIWVLLLLACAVAGVLLVVLLFVLNLTIVDGDIYGFLLYINLLSIYCSRIFPQQHRQMYIPIMLANLDLGFEVCFYDGMTSYATIWLQFLFPIYMIVIVIGLSFASRCFRFIERLTRKRVIPVIATLYLLACNKMILTTAKGFSYRKVHYLNSGETELYWAVDTSIPFMGAEFIVQLVFCSLIFLFILIPTVVLFLVPKHFLRYKFVAKFLKPFLDAYQAPLKDNCYYFLGIELLLRVIVCGLDSVPANFTAEIFTAILLIYLVFLTIFQPFKNSFNGALYSVYGCILGCIALLFLSYAPEMPMMYAVIFDILVYLGMLIFLGIVIAHFLQYVLHQDLDSYFHRKCKLLSLESMINTSNNSAVVAGSYENLRDDLLVIDPDL